MSKYLIINADDFGYCPEQNEAIKVLLLHKLITSTSVLTVAPCFADAAQWLKENSISAGVHLTLNSDGSENPWKSITGDKSLGKDGAFFTKQSDITLHGRHRAVRRELEAQYNALISVGVEVDHADNHSGTLYGINLRRFYVDAYAFCGEHNLPYRFPELPGFIESQIGRKAPAPIIYLQKMLVGKGKKAGVKLLADLVSNPWNMQRIGSFETLREWYLNAVESCVDGVTEIFLHPSQPIDDRPSEWTKRVYEYRLLKSGDLLQKAEDKHIKVISWKDYAQGNL